MLAQLQLTAVELAAYLAATAFVLGFINQGLKLVDRIKSKPPGEQLQLSTEQLERRMSLLEQTQKDDRVDATAQRRDLHRSIDLLGREMAGANKALELGNQRMASIERKLDNIIDRRGQ